MNIFEKISQIFAPVLKRTTSSPHLTFSIRKTVVEHTIFCEALKKITDLHQRGVTAKVAGGLLITGQTGSGKTTLAEFYKEYFPQVEESDRSVLPVVLVTTPESPTVKSLAEAILIALGDPAAGKGTTEEKTRRIFRYLKECRVELLMIDEFQHFYDSRQVAQTKKVTDWLKNLFNIAGIPVVLFGLPRSVMVVRSNPQLRRRFSAPFYMRPFAFDTEQEQKEFRAILKVIHSKLPLPCVELHEANLARRFYYASHGLFDFVAKIIDRAVLFAGEQGDDTIGMKHFAFAFQEEVWREVPKQLNPFNEKAIQRDLTKTGEPFEIWDDPAQYFKKRTQ